MDNNYIIQLITKLDGSKTPNDLKKIEQQLNAKGINIKTSLDTATSKQELQNLAKQLQSVLKSSGLEIDTSKILSAFNQVSKEAQNVAEKVKTIKTSLNDGSYSTQIEKLKTQFQKYGLSVDEAENKVKELRTTLSTMKTSSGDKLVSEFKNWETQIKGVNVQLDQTKLTYDQISKANKIQLSMGANGNTTAQIEVLRNNFTKLGLSADEVKSKMRGVDTEVKALQSLMNSGAENSVIVTQFEKLQTVLTQTQNNLKQTRSDYSLLATEQQRLSLANAIEAWNQKNTAATRAVREENERYVVSLRDLNTQMTKIDFNKINTGFKQNENSMRALNRLGASLKNQWIQATQSFTMWLSASRLVMTVMTKLRQMPQTVKELDTSLVDLKKTTSMTTSQLEDFYYAANDVAKQMGVTTKEIIDQASAWSRLGYSSQEAATKMAKYSSMFASISPGMDVDTATNGLVSIMKAFDIGNDNPDDVLDGIMSKVNIIGNTAATSNAEIVNMLSKSSSAMKEANNTLEETIALETAAVEITRDDDSVGTAFKTLSMRIRGYDEETESYTNNVEELSGKIADLTKTASTPGGISLFTDASKTEFKSTYQLLSEISKVYDQLSDKNQAQLLEVLAGKRQGQIVAATINNFQAAEKAMDNMAKSAGNAEAEMSVIMDSLDYKLNKNKETWTGVAQNLFQREDMKAIVDAFTSIGEAVDFATDKLGLFGAIGLGAGIFAGFKNVGRLKMQSLIVLNCRQ